MTIDEHIDYISEIKELKEKKNAIIIAHYYQTGDIQDIADFVGDSLALSQRQLQMMQILSCSQVSDSWLKLPRFCLHQKKFCCPI